MCIFLRPIKPLERCDMLSIWLMLQLLTTLLYWGEVNSQKTSAEWLPTEQQIWKDNLQVFRIKLSRHSSVPIPPCLLVQGNQKLKKNITKVRAFVLFMVTLFQKITDLNMILYAACKNRPNILFRASLPARIFLQTKAKNTMQSKMFFGVVVLFYGLWEGDIPNQNPLIRKYHTKK